MSCLAAWQDSKVLNCAAPEVTPLPAEKHQIRIKHQGVIRVPHNYYG